MLPVTFKLIDLIAIKEQLHSNLHSASSLILKVSQLKTEKDFRGSCFLVCSP